MTEDEIGEQLASARTFRLDAGRLGYLRAAIGMKRENALLRSIFPPEYWYNTTGEPVPFDFRSRQAALDRGARIYLRSVIENSVPNFEDYALVAAMDSASSEAVQNSGLEEVAATKDLEIETAKRWLQEVVEFFDLGTKKQEDGLNPEVLISW